MKKTEQKPGSRKPSPNHLPLLDRTFFDDTCLVQCGENGVDRER